MGRTYYPTPFSAISTGGAHLNELAIEFALLDHTISYQLDKLGLKLQLGIGQHLIVQHLESLIRNDNPHPLVDALTESDMQPRVAGWADATGQEIRFSLERVLDLGLWRTGGSRQT